MQFGYVLVKKSGERWHQPGLSVCLGTLTAHPAHLHGSSESGAELATLVSHGAFSRRTPVIKMHISQWRALKCPLIPLAVGESTVPLLGGDGLIFPSQAQYRAGCATCWVSTRACARAANILCHRYCSLGSASHG